MENLAFQMPWMELAIIAGVSWVASMLMTIIPAWQASKIYPAEALRYE
jgi:ABC-type lipoprotein release transport system permease subunit